jgi:SAM-dependent methyltransferase
MLKKIAKIVKKEQFQPGFIALFTNPFYFSRRGLYRGIIEYGHFITGKTLDVGCGQRPYENLVACTKYVGLELDTPAARKMNKADLYYKGKRFPFRKESFDSVMINQVFEHVFNPDEFLQEVNRVLKQGGRLLMTVPFVWDEHEQPHDYARYSSFGLAWVLNKNGFKIVKQKKSVNDIGILFQLVNGFIYKKVETRFLLLNHFFFLFLIAPFNILGALLILITPKSSDLYLDNIILAEKIRNV